MLPYNRERHGERPPIKQALKKYEGWILFTLLLIRGRRKM